ncbi:MAG: TonB-dependent receptor [Bacteroidetes bacterium]|nr:TonB-dependent receptor [Bacteroidota bacterium]
MDTRLTKTTLCAVFFLSLSLIVFNLIPVDLFAQKPDTLSFEMKEDVLVTATRYARSVETTSLPVSIIKSEDIKNEGCLTLKDILETVNGLAITQDHGSGIQMEGLSPEYTLILIDGQPVIGRTAGTLELSRISALNIERIEIVRGPSSSLYGSDALAGVINILTRSPEKNQLSFSSRISSNQSQLVQGDAGFSAGEVNSSLSASYLNSGGYDLDPSTRVKTVDPFSNYTLHFKSVFQINDRDKLMGSLRTFSEKQNPFFEVSGDPGNTDVSGQAVTTDFSGTAEYSTQFFGMLRSTLTYYYSTYHTKEKLVYQGTDSLYDESGYRQDLHRPEWFSSLVLSPESILSFGLGSSFESVSADRYASDKKYRNDFIFGQVDMAVLPDLQVIGGLRFDHPSVYESQLSPKLSFSYLINPIFSLNGSAGTGFKAPDFRQLYLTFTNPVAGYSVFGTHELVGGIRHLTASNQIAALYSDPVTFSDIKPEKSIAFNLGFSVKKQGIASVNLNFFRNNVSNLIETLPVAMKTNGAMVFSYTNLSEIYTQGANLESTINLPAGFVFSAGYQFLMTADKSVKRLLTDGKVFKRDPVTLITKKVNPDDYGGLFSRSKHAGQAKLTWKEPEGNWNAHIQMTARGRYGFADKNGNTILDDDSEYVPGYFLFNVAAGKDLFNGFHLQAGCDNLTDFTNPGQISGIQGRYVWVSLDWQIF